MVTGKSKIKYGSIVEGLYHYDLVGIDVKDEDKALPFVARWIEGMEDRFSAIKNEETLKKALQLVNKRKHHVKPVKIPTPTPVNVALQIAHDSLMKDGFELKPLDIRFGEEETEYQYVNRLRSSTPWQEIYNITENAENKISRITAEYSLSNSESLTVTISIILPVNGCHAVLGVGMGGQLPMPCKSADEFVSNVCGKRTPWRALEV